MNPLLASQASIRANRASNDTQSITNTDDAIIGDDNTDVVISTENTDNAAIDADNTNIAATDGEKTDDATMSDNNTDNAATGDGNMDNTAIGEASTVHIPLPPSYGGKDPSQIKTSTKCTPAIAELSSGDLLLDDHTTVKASGHTVDLTDVHMYEFLIQGAPNPHDLEGYRGGSITRNTKKYTR